MCTYHDIIMHNGIIMNHFYYVLQYLLKALQYTAQHILKKALSYTIKHLPTEEGT